MSNHSQAGALKLQKRKSTRPVAVFWKTKIRASTAITAGTINLRGNLPPVRPDLSIKSIPRDFYRIGRRAIGSPQHS